MRGLDLFSGIGGISLALKSWVTTVAYCEQNPFSQAVLLERMHSNDLDIAPIWDDVRTLNREILDTEIDIITGGFPCQDISIAGRGKGLAGERSGLFFEIVRLAKELKPSFLFLENVPAITGRGLSTVAREIAALGYDCRWGVLSAYDVGAPHKRERWFLLAYTDSKGMEGLRQPCGTSKEKPYSYGVVGGGDDPDSDCVRGLESKGLQQDEWRRNRDVVSATTWETLPIVVSGMDNGVSCRMDRIKALGNSVVPTQARDAFCRLAGIRLQGG